MLAALKQKYSLEEYFEFDGNSEGKFEWRNGRVVEISGVSLNHGSLEVRLSYLFGKNARNTDCEAFPSSMKVSVPALPTYRYPDLSVACGEAKFIEIGGLQCLANPVLLVEVLSESTESYDRGEKFRQYKSIESFREYLLISSQSANVTHYLKHNDRFWLQSDYVAGELLHITTLDFDLVVDEIYQGITFEPRTDADERR